MMSEENKPQQDQKTEEPSGDETLPSGENVTRELADCEKKAAEYLENWKRAQADYANLRKHTEIEKQDAVRFGNAQLITRLLPVLDDFERAFTHVSHKEVKTEWVEGIKLIESKLMGVLQVYGVTQIHAMHKPFDPNLHEACGHIPGPEGIVIQECARGYKLFDKVIRPTQAIVGNGEKTQSEDSEKPVDKT
jgi:molecular chaperone GrpE